MCRAGELNSKESGFRKGDFPGAMAEEKLACSFYSENPGTHYYLV
jgi:hypothetical protein